MGLVSFGMEFEIDHVYFSVASLIVSMLRPLCRVESGINKTAKYQESLFKEVIFLEVISFDVEMQLPALKGQLSPPNGLRGIPLLRMRWERLWEKIPSRKSSVAVLGKNINAP